MNNRQLYLELRRILSGAGIPEAAFEANLLLEQLTGEPRFSDRQVNPEMHQKLMELARRRASREPLQYLLGRWPFLDLELEVGPGVLSPRPETEEVCLAAVDGLLRSGQRTALDLCAGSGAIALGLQSRVPDAEITAVELCPTAFEYLQKNIGSYQHIFGRVPRPVLADVREYHQQIQPQSMQLVVSNPPYVTQQEYSRLQPELYHEPRQALVAPEDGLAFYKSIARDYYDCLAVGGFLVFEIGAAQGEAVGQILRHNRYSDIRIQQDLAGLDRIVIGIK